MADFSIPKKISFLNFTSPISQFKAFSIRIFLNKRFGNFSNQVRINYSRCFTIAEILLNLLETQEKGFIIEAQKLKLIHEIVT